MTRMGRWLRELLLLGSGDAGSPGWSEGRRQDIEARLQRVEKEGMLSSVRGGGAPRGSSACLCQRTSGNCWLLMFFTGLVSKGMARDVMCSELPIA
jgi:hypothetical protein